MTASTPLITIGITCYNEGDWLLECWESVLAQTDDRWTAVLVMDGTTHERTREVFEQLQHPRLRKYAMPANAGPYPTGNKAVEVAQTPYHFWIAADDRLMPDAVKMVLDTFEQYPDTGIVSGDLQCFGGAKEIWHYPREFGPKELCETQCAPGPCAFSKKLWEQLGGFSTELRQGNGDYDFVIGAVEAGVPVRHCGGIFVHYRRGHASVSGSYQKNYYESHEIMVRRHPRFFADPRRRNRFLALGYFIAARAHYSAHDLGRSRKLLFTALRYGMWNDPQWWGLALRLALPESVMSLLRRLPGMRLSSQ